MIQKRWMWVVLRMKRWMWVVLGKKRWMWIVLGLAITGGIIASLLVFVPSKSQKDTFDESFTVTAEYQETYTLTATNCTVEGFVINNGNVDLQFTVVDPLGFDLESETVKAHTQYDFSFRTLEYEAKYAFIFEVSHNETSVDIHLHLEEE